MSHLNQRLHTVQPGHGDQDRLRVVDAQPVPVHNTDIGIDRSMNEPPPTPPPQHKPPRQRRARRKRRRSDFEIRLSEHSTSLKTLLKRFVSGWMVSLIVHCLMMAWLASLITQFHSDGPLTLTVSMADDEANDVISVNIADMEFDSELDDSQSEQALEIEESPIDPLEIVEPELPVEIDLISEAASLESLLDSQGDDSLLQPVNLGTLGLDEGDGQSDSKNKGRSAKVKFFGLESSGDRFIFVVDCSGSMGDERRYQRAIYELTQSMRMLETNHKFLVILYNTETIPMLGMTQNNIRMISATRTNKERVVDWLERQTPTSQTMPMVAMQTSLQLKPSSIYFLSDGEFHDRTIPMLHQFNIDDQSAGRNKIPVNTITLGSTGLGAPMMKHIADESGGSFLWVR